MIMATTEVAPIFKHNFDRFLNFLNDEAYPASISPKRFGQVLSLDMQTFAAKAHVRRNTISRAPAAEREKGRNHAGGKLPARVSLPGSVDPDIGGPDDFSPIIDVVLDHRIQLGWRHVAGCEFLPVWCEDQMNAEITGAAHVLALWQRPICSPIYFELSANPFRL
jgi:hypothetical protein